MGAGYEKAITKALDECLLTDAEWAQWEKVMNSKKLKTMEKKVRRQPAVDCPSLRRLTLVSAAKGARGAVRRRLRGVGGE